MIWQRCDEIHPSFKLLLKYSIIFRTFIYGSLFYGVSALIYFEIFTNGWLIPLLKGEISWFVRNFEYFSKIILVPIIVFAFGLIMGKKIKSDII